jgi:hypothetical protein
MTLPMASYDKDRMRKEFSVTRRCSLLAMIAVGDPVDSIEGLDQ